jgi:hypothetical protein
VIASADARILFDNEPVDERPPKLVTSAVLPVKEPDPGGPPADHNMAHVTDDRLVQAAG